jgi:hypothetical protein
MAKITDRISHQCNNCRWWGEYQLDPNFSIGSLDKRCNIPDDQECHSGSGFKERGI